MSQLSRQPVGDLPRPEFLAPLTHSVVNRIRRRIDPRGYGRLQLGLHTADANYLRRRLGQGSVTSIVELRRWPHRSAPAWPIRPRHSEVRPAIPIEDPRSLSGFDGLRIILLLVMGARERRQPDKETGILGAEADCLFRQLNRRLRVSSIEVHLTENGVGRGVARIESDCLLETQYCAIAASRPHEDDTEREMGWRITGIETDCTLGQLLGFNIIPSDIVCPA
jgi:hypothetical protein